MKPLISIIMTVYNNEKYFPIAVNNILKQDFENWELIIVDDGSTDKTSQIADELARKDQRIKVIHQSNQWVYAALNNGIAEAAGEYIFVHNSDDTIRQGSLKILADRIETYHPDVIWTHILYHICDSEQNIIEYDYTHFENLIPEEYVCKTKIEVENNWLNFWKNYFSTNQVNLYKASVMKKYKFREDMFCSDAMFNTDIADEIQVAIVLDVPIYDCYRYQVDDMNASVGKWYANEHEMYNLMYLGFRELYLKWNRPKEEAIDYWNDWRIKKISEELYRLAFLCNSLSVDEKIRLVLNDYVDDVLMKCAKESGREAEVHRRILAGCRNILKDSEGIKDKDLCFVQRLVDAFSEYEKGNAYTIEEVDVTNKLNLYQIGVFLIRGNK